MFWVMTPWRNFGESGPETEMRRLDERETRPDCGGADEGGRVGADEKDFWLRREDVAAVLQLGHMKEPVADDVADDDESPRRLRTRLLLGLILFVSCPVCDFLNMPAGDSEKSNG